MLKDEILEKLFAHPEIQKIPIGHQESIIRAYTEILEQKREENPYDTISELFSE